VRETRAAGAAAAESSEQQMREEGEELRKRWDHKWQISFVRHSYFKHPGPPPPLFSSCSDCLLFVVVLACYHLPLFLFIIFLKVCTYPVLLCFLFLIIISLLLN
jgi:hypothetical protein